MSLIPNFTQNDWPVSCSIVLRADPAASKVTLDL